MRRVLPVAARRWVPITIAGALCGSAASALVAVGSSYFFDLAGWVLWVVTPVSGALLGALIGLQRFALPTSQKADMSLGQRVTGWDVWWLWTIGSSVGLVIGLPIGFKLGRMTLSKVFVLTGFNDPATMFLLRAAVIGIVAGTALGLAQQIVMRHVLPVVRRWTILTGAGALGGSIAASVVLVIPGALVGSRSYLLVAAGFGWVLAPLCGGLLGAVIGLLQLLALPPRFPRRRWVLGSSVSWCLGVCVVFAGFLFSLSGWSGDPGSGRSRGEISAILTVTLVIAVLCIAATSGASLAWLLHRIPPTTCRSCGYDLRGAAGTICPECGQECAVHSGATRLWHPGKRAVWYGILGFSFAFIGVMFLTEGGRSFALGVSGWGTPSAIPWVVKSLGAGVLVGGPIGCFIGGVVDKKRG